MTASTLERPAPPTVHGGRRPARRAVVRWAWRLFRREWRQQFLILALITAAVAATILGAAVAANTPPPPNAGFGTADHLVQMPGDMPHLTAGIAAVRQRFGPVDVIENRTLVTGTVQHAELRAQDPHGRFGGPMLALRSGRYPAGPGEVAMTREMASTYGVHVGGTWRDGGQAYRVVGLVENPQNLLDTFALVAPGRLTTADRVTVLFDGGAPEVDAFAFPGGVKAQALPPPPGVDPAVIVLLIAIVGLIFVGLLAVTGFAAMAQRRLRSLGLLSSLGATDGDVRLVMLASGAVLGAVASVAGAAIGLSAWIAYAPHLQTASHHRILVTSLPWWLIVATMILAVLTAVLAANRPARAAARLSTVAALSGRPPVPRSVHRSMVPGAVLLVAGLLLLAYSDGWTSMNQRENLFKLGGILGTSAGVLLFAPAGITLLAVIGRHAPVAARLALRDLGRYRTRSGPALAAISFAVFIATIVGLLATARYADPVDYFAPNLPTNQLIAYLPGNAPGNSGPVQTAAGTPADRAAKLATDQAAAQSIAASLGSHDVLALDTTDAAMITVKNGMSLQGPGTVYVATAALLSRYGIDPGSIDPSALLITSRPGLEKIANLRLRPALGPDDPQCTPATCALNPKIQQVRALPTGASAPNLLITQHALDVLHLQPRPAGWLIHTAAPLTPAQINSARQTAVAAGLTIETKNGAPSLAELRNYAAGSGILLALAVLAMTVGLIRGEAAADLRTLAANGASGRTRRAITATTASALGLTGALLGTVIGYAAIVALFRSELSERLTPLPIIDILLVVVGLPLIATIGSWLLAGREPPAVARQAIE